MAQFENKSKLLRANQIARIISDLKMGVINIDTKPGIFCTVTYTNSFSAHSFDLRLTKVY